MHASLDAGPWPQLSDPWRRSCNVAGVWCLVLWSHVSAAILCPHWVFSAEIKTQLLPPLMNTAGRHREREQRQGVCIQTVHMTCTGCISGLVAEYIVAIDVTRAQFPADADLFWIA